MQKSAKPAQPAGITSYALHKTAKLAYRKAGDGDWEPLSVAQVPQEGLTRTGYERIGERWLTVYAVAAL